MSRCLPDVEDMPGFFANNAGVLLEGGNALFVDNAAGFIRLNLAMPRTTIETGLKRIRDAVNMHKSVVGLGDLSDIVYIRRLFILLLHQYEKTLFIFHLERCYFYGIIITNSEE